MPLFGVRWRCREFNVSFAWQTHNRWSPCTAGVSADFGVSCVSFVSFIYPEPEKKVLIFFIGQRLKLTHITHTTHGHSAQARAAQGFDGVS